MANRKQPFAADQKVQVKCARVQRVYLWGVHARWLDMVLASGGRAHWRSHSVSRRPSQRSLPLRVVRRRLQISQSVCECVANKCRSRDIHYCRSKSNFADLVALLSLALSGWKKDQGAAGGCERIYFWRTSRLPSPTPWNNIHVLSSLFSCRLHFCGVVRIRALRHAPCVVVATGLLLVLFIATILNRCRSF